MSDTSWGERERETERREREKKERERRKRERERGEREIQQEPEPTRLSASLALRRARQSFCHPPPTHLELHNVSVQVPLGLERHLCNIKDLDARLVLASRDDVLLVARHPDPLRSDIEVEVLDYLNTPAIVLVLCQRSPLLLAQPLWQRLAHRQVVYLDAIGTLRGLHQRGLVELVRHGCGEGGKKSVWSSPGEGGRALFVHWSATTPANTCLDLSLSSLPSSSRGGRFKPPLQD